MLRRLRTFDYLTFALLAILAIPCLLILITWSALPGDRLYIVKRGLEKAALVLAAADWRTEAVLRTKLVARRFDEAGTLLDERQSTAGLDQFNSEVESTKQQIIKEGQEAKEDKATEEQTTQFISQLKTYNHELEVKKQTFSPSPVVIVPSPPKPTPSPSIAPPGQVSLVKPSPSASPDQKQPPDQTKKIVRKINQSQHQINKAIEDLEELKGVGTQESEVKPLQKQNQPEKDKEKEKKEEQEKQEKSSLKKSKDKDEDDDEDERDEEKEEEDDDNSDD